MIKPVSFHKTALSRQISEAVRIRRRGGEGAILNSKAEFSRCYIPRLQVEPDEMKEQREKKEREELELLELELLELELELLELELLELELLKLVELLESLLVFELLRLL